MSKKSNPLPTRTYVQTIRLGDVVVETTTVVRDAIIDYADILAKAYVTDDEDMRSPWVEDDGWEHELVRNIDEIEPYRSHFEEIRLSLAAIRVDRSWCLIKISRQALEEQQGKFQPEIESRAAYEERLAAARKSTIRILVRWYAHGWAWFRVDLVFQGHHASLGGIQTDNDTPDDPYLDDVKHELAREIVANLEEEGYKIINKPEEPERSPQQSHASWLRLYALGFADYAEYRAWLSTRPRLP